MIWLLYSPMTLVWLALLGYFAWKLYLELDLANDFKDGVSVPALLTASTKVVPAVTALAHRTIAQLAAAAEAQAQAGDAGAAASSGGGGGGQGGVVAAAESSASSSAPAGGSEAARGGGNLRQRRGVSD
jgi:hypothetical protein